MKGREGCPVCGDPYGRAELVGDGRDRVRFWHTDLTEVTEFCLDYCDGGQDKVESSPTLLN